MRRGELGPGASCRSCGAFTKGETRVRCVSCDGQVHRACRESNKVCTRCNEDGHRTVQLWCADVASAMAVVNRFSPFLSDGHSIRRVHMFAVVTYWDRKIPRDIARYAVDNGLCTRRQADAFVRDMIAAVN